MSRSSEWQFNLWPVDVRIGIRVAHLSDATAVADAPPGNAAGRGLPGGDLVAVSGLTALEGSILVWEAEGGSLGPSDGEPEPVPTDFRS